MDAFLGVDLGTSGLKLALLGVDGSLLGEAEAGYELTRPRPGWAETDPRQWVEAYRRALDLLPRDHRLAGIGVTGQMHGAVLCDRSGAPVRPAILWPDRRADAELGRWRRLPPTVQAGLANPLVPGMTGPIASWLTVHEPSTMADAAHLLLPKDYLRTIITGGPFVTERSDASATLLWDVVADRWSPEAVAASGIDPAILPPVVDCTAVVGHTPGGVPVIAGAADTPAAMVASGSNVDGLQINLGTGAQVLRRVPSPHPVHAPVTHLYATADKGWYAMAAVQNAGLALDWAGTLLGLAWPDLIAAAHTAPAGAGGVSFLPFLTGERGALAGPASRGAWLGLQASTTRADLARAAVEAMIFAVRRAAELLIPLDFTSGTEAPTDDTARLTDDTARLTGGSARLTDDATRRPGGAVLLPDDPARLTGDSALPTDDPVRLPNGGARLTDDPARLTGGSARLTDGAALSTDGPVRLPNGGARLTGDPARLTGGGGRESLIQHLLADSLRVAVRRVEVRSASATGAAMLAATGTGLTLIPRRTEAPPVEPEPAGALDDAYARWLSRLPAADA